MNDKGSHKCHCLRSGYHETGLRSIYANWVLETDILNEVSQHLFILVASGNSVYTSYQGSYLLWYFLLLGVVHYNFSVFHNHQPHIYYIFKISRVFFSCNGKGSC